MSNSESDCVAGLVAEPLSVADAEQTARILKALGDPVRLRLVSLIASHEGGEACVCDLTEAFDLTAPTISHHLKVLREAGVVSSERRGTWIHYRVDTELFVGLSGLLGRFSPVPISG